MERIKNIDVNLIYKLCDEYAAAYNAGDLERWLLLWSDDCVQIPPDALEIMGVDQLRDAHKSRFAGYDCEVKHSLNEVQVLGDWAHAFGSFELLATPKNGGNPTIGAGKFLSILNKQRDGAWKISRECINFDKSCS